MFYVFLAKKNWSLSPLKLKIWQSELPRRVCGYVIDLCCPSDDEKQRAKKTTKVEVSETKTVIYRGRIRW